jgi:hypothetical protein
MKRLSLILAVAAVVAVWPASSGAATFKGVVVAKQHGALLVASPAGVVTAVAGRASIGSRVTVSGGHVTIVGRAHVARVRGIVVRHIGATLFLSSNRHLVAVHTGRVLASASDTTPAPPTTPTTPTTPATGDIVSAQVTIGSSGELDEDSSQNLGSSNASTLQVQAVVAAVGPGTVTLTVGTQTLTVPLPAGLTLPASMVGQTVTLSLDLNGQNGQNGDSSDDDNGDNGSGGSGGSGGGGNGG